MTTHTTWGRFGNTKEHEGLSAFALEDGVVHHTYQCHLRGVEEFNVTDQLLDRAPRGRDEGKLPYPRPGSIAGTNTVPVAAAIAAPRRREGRVR